MAADDPGRQPFAGTCEVAIHSGGPGGTIGPVPANKRWVVETISVMATIPPGGTIYMMQFDTPGFSMWLAPTQVPDGLFGLRHYVANSALRFYVEPGNSVQFSAYVGEATAETLCFISGYLLDV